MKNVMRQDEVRQKCSLSKLGKPGAKLSEQHKAAISFAQRNLTPEQRKRKSDAKLGVKNGMTGKIWVTNGETRKVVSPNQIPNGFYIKTRN